MKQKLTSVLLFFVASISMAQSIDFEQFGMNDPLKISGGISANSVFYNSNRSTAARAPFTYFLQGALNVSLYGFSMPISYSFTNQGQNLNYQLPFNFNRLSLHPSYKWVTGHIGDVSMSFSPYTLNGHQFTGGGIELSPKGHFKISAMGGRLLKATEDDGDGHTVPAFERMGYGLKFTYDARRFSIGLIGFYAKDDIHSLEAVPEVKNVLPKENLVLSVEGRIDVTSKLKVFTEFASSAMTQDLRAKDQHKKMNGLAGLFLNSKASTEHYSAFKAGVDYQFGQSSVGVTYERIEPGYETLGAYYFNSDFENITINAATALFKNKLNLSFNVGYQRDDLDNQKVNATSRMVGSVNVSSRINDRLSINGSYSNFRTYTNAKMNQFEYINDDNLLDNDLDTLNYKQLSQNAFLSINYVLSQKENQQQNLAFNYNVNEVVNKQNGIARIGDVSIFHNVNTAYTLSFPKSQFSLTTAMNATLNSIGRQKTTTFGPTLSVNKGFFDQKMRAGLSFSYNATNTTAGQTSVTNIRARVAYSLLKRHHINLSLIQLFRESARKNKSPSLREFTATLGYNYSFALSPNFKLKRKYKKTKLSYGGYTFEDERAQISPQVIAVAKTEEFAPLLVMESIKSDLNKLSSDIYRAEVKKDADYQQAVEAYIHYLYKQKRSLETYNDLVFDGLRKLYAQALEVYQMDAEELKAAKAKSEKYIGHTHLVQQLNDFTYQDVVRGRSPLDQFKKEHAEKIFNMLEHEKSEKEIQRYIDEHLTDIYHKKAVHKLNMH